MFGLLFVTLLSFALASEPQRIRGVNLGGWLVIEPWIKPSLFAPFINMTSSDTPVDEWTFCAYYGQEKCLEILEAHWDSWFQESDLQTLSQNGINFLRIPIGYWAIDLDPSIEPYVNGQLKYLHRVLEWAYKYDLQVMIDLHGAPGSQNGFDNSGRRGDPHWQEYYTSDHTQRCESGFLDIERTLKVLRNITSDVLSSYASLSLKPSGRRFIFGVELVNEPWVKVDINIVEYFYQKGYETVRDADPSTDEFHQFAISMHDSFRFSNWYGKFSSPAYNNTYLDTHIYQAFVLPLMTNKTGHWGRNLEAACFHESSLKNMSLHKWTFVGEWSLGVDDCTPWLNGFQHGARFDGTFGGAEAVDLKVGDCINDHGQDASKYSPEFREFLGKFFIAQTYVYSRNAQGWVFWNAKTESSPAWDYLLGLKEGWIVDVSSDSYFGDFSCPRDEN